MIQPIGPQQGVQGAQRVDPQRSASHPGSPGKANSSAQTSFGAVLQQERSKSAPPTQTQDVAFSKHAFARAEERGIQVDDDLLTQLRSSVERAQAKGATNILAFDAQRAFIINVPNSRVITTMSQAEMKDNIFTNIDGAVLL